MPTTTTQSSLTSIKTRKDRKRRIATSLLNAHQAQQPTLPPPGSTQHPSAIRIICISDTHNARPSLPPGDVLIHSGDLTENGSFDEVQAGLDWLSSQPHAHKIFVAGNHDVLLDETFLEGHPKRRYGDARTRGDLRWGSVTYLQDSSAVLDIPPRDDEGKEEAAVDGTQRRRRQLTVFGSPWTPKYGTSAFQYRPDSAEDHWRDVLGRAPDRVDVLVTHGPPRFHLDRRDFHRAGCPHLSGEVHRRGLRPRLQVFGHIHASYGREEVRLDGLQRVWEEVMSGWAGWGDVAWMAVLVLWGRVKAMGRRSGEGVERGRTFVNASVVGGPGNALRNEAIVFDM